MAKRLQEYVKYTANELESYIKSEDSCVKKINSDFHLSIGPYSLSNFKKALLNHIVQTQIGFFSSKLNGIVLDIKKIKVLGNVCALRFDDPKVHVNINADCYVFRPAIGAVLSGIVKYISTKHVGAIIYRVFNATIRFSNTLAEGDVEMDKEIKFRIKNFNMQNLFPYIEGELLLAADTSGSQHGAIKQIDEIKEENNENGDITTNNDSGIEEKDTNELDEVIHVPVKHETTYEVEDVPTPKKKSSSKRKRSSVSISDISKHASISDISVKEEISTHTKSKKTKRSNISQDLAISVKKEIET